MSNTCILTDSTAQFPSPIFDGRALVNVIALDIQLSDKLYPGGVGLKANDLPITTRHGLQPQVYAPSVEKFEQTFQELSKRYSEIVCMLHPDQLSDTIKHARQAAKITEGRVSIEVIDCQTTAIGLGLLVQAAAEAAENGASAEEVEKLIRSLMPKTYTTFCIQGLSYLNNNGYLSDTQAFIGEHLRVLPVFILEEGRLVPTQKARNNRHLVDILHEFLWEFPDLEHIAILQAVPAFEQETRALRERIVEDFEDTPISEHTINATLAAMIGPRSLGIFVKQ